MVTERDDCAVEDFDRISSVLHALKHTKFGKGDDVVPEHFLCPISSEIMRDPVMLATGQTYDRPYIQAWFDADHHTCPKTQQVLPARSLTPNYLVRSMIEQWCDTHEANHPTRSSDKELANAGIMPQEAKYLSILLDKLQGNFQSQQREAARELRVLTKKKHSHRVFLGEPHTVAVLKPLLQSPDAETQEHVVTTFFNLSIYEANKKLIANEGAIEYIVEVLSNSASDAARENAAATLFSLSAVDENKTLIGASGAIPALVDLLRTGKTAGGKKDAASALFNLCLHNDNKATTVRTGIVPVLMRLIADDTEGMCDAALAILSLLSGHEEGVKAILDDPGLLSLLMGFVKGSSRHNTENAVVVIVALCKHEVSLLTELRLNHEYTQALVALSHTGSSRAKRKATFLVQQINKQIRSVTI